MLNDTRGELQQTFCAAAGLNILTQAINPCTSVNLRTLTYNTHASMQCQTKWMNNEIRSVKPDKPYFDFADTKEKVDFPLHKKMNII